MQQFPLLTASRLLEGGLRAAALRAKEQLLEGSEAVAPGRKHLAVPFGVRLYKPIGPLGYLS